MGSFVYLRRIFEGLVEEAHRAAHSSLGWDEVLYQQSRMSERIRLLEPYLPKFLVENRALYGILSKGIHELSEDECLAAFPAVNLGIEIVLDAKYVQPPSRRSLQRPRWQSRSLLESVKPNLSFQPTAYGGG